MSDYFKMTPPPLFGCFLVSLCLAVSLNSLWADSYPEMKSSVKCNQRSDTKAEKAINSLRKKMQQQLEVYNKSRFKMADILRAMVIDYSLRGYSKKRILGYAGHFEDLSNNAPNFDPETADYKNFDFRLGLSFASTTIFLNTTDDVSKHFLADQKDPESNLSKYVAEIDREGEIYQSMLNNYQNKFAANCI